MGKKKQIVKWIMGIVIFLTVFVVLFAGLSYLLRPITQSKKNVCGLYAEQKNSLDVVYIGGSACYTSWQPLNAWNQYGFTSYNFAMDALPPQMIKNCIVEVQKSQEPELWIVDLRPFQYGDLPNYVEGDEENEQSVQPEEMRMYREAAMRNVVDSWPYSWNRIDAIRNGVPENQGRIYYYFDISKYHSLFWGSIVDKEAWEYLFNRKENSTKGFVAQTDVRVIDYFDYSQLESEKELVGEVSNSFIDVLEYCKENDLQVLFIVHAYQQGEEDKEKYNYMQRIIEEYGFDYLNVNDYWKEIGFDRTADFQDVNHVNLLGADKYTDFLATYLNDNYSFRDKREDENYSSWNEDFAEWDEQMKALRSDMVE